MPAEMPDYHSDVSEAAENARSIALRLLTARSRSQEGYAAELNAAVRQAADDRAFQFALIDQLVLFGRMMSNRVISLDSDFADLSELLRTYEVAADEMTDDLRHGGDSPQESDDA